MIVNPSRKIQDSNLWDLLGTYELATRCNRPDSANLPKKPTNPEAMGSKVPNRGLEPRTACYQHAVLTYGLDRFGDPLHGFELDLTTARHGSPTDCLTGMRGPREFRNLDSLFKR